MKRSKSAGTERAKTAAIYRKAAELCVGGRYASCYAVNQASCRIHDNNTPEAESYKKLFSPNGRGPNTLAWGLQWSDRSGPFHRVIDHEVEECRILALCFAAAMAETGDL